jgi:hypothetical protein
MPKKNATADELIWLFHEKLAGSNFPKAKIAIIPIGVRADECHRTPVLP